jgi:hypothetical protein
MTEKIQTETLGGGTAAQKSKSGRVIPDTPALKQSGSQPAADKMGVTAKLGHLTYETLTSKVREEAQGLRRSHVQHAKHAGEIVDFIAYGMEQALSRIPEFMGFADRKWLGHWLIETGVVETLTKDREADKGTASRWRQMAQWSSTALQGDKTQQALAGGVKIGDTTYFSASDALRNSGLSSRAVYLAYAAVIQAARAQGPGGRRSSASEDPEEAVEQAVTGDKFKVAVKDEETGKTEQVSVTSSKALTHRMILSLVEKFAGQWTDDEIQAVYEAMSAPAAETTEETDEAKPAEKVA